MTRIFWFLSQIASKLWFCATFYGVAAIITALAAIYFRQFIPDELPQKIGADAVDSILNILAASMLSVTIFSLSTMVSAYSAVTSSVTPRATKLLLEDKLSHRALSTFLGSFIFSIVGIIALKTGLYGDKGRFILFAVTIFVIVIIVVTLLRWIEYLARLGRVNETIDRVEHATHDALLTRLKKPYLGGQPLIEDVEIPSVHIPVLAGITGYVQHIDMPHLNNVAKEHNAEIYVLALPGKFLDENISLALVCGAQNPDIADKIRKGFITGPERSYQQDPRFGLAVLHEIACRALSPAVNDPGTAIQVIGTVVRILTLWTKRNEYLGENYEADYLRVYVPALNINDLYDDFFPPVSRDAAGNLEVHLRLQRAYEALSRSQCEELKQAAMHHSDLSLKRALKHLDLEEDKKTIEAAHDFDKSGLR